MQTIKLPSIVFIFLLCSSLVNTTQILEEDLVSQLKKIVATLTPDKEIEIQNQFAKYFAEEEAKQKFPEKGTQPTPKDTSSVREGIVIFCLDPIDGPASLEELTSAIQPLFVDESLRYDFKSELSKSYAISMRFDNEYETHTASENENASSLTNGEREREDLEKVNIQKPTQTQRSRIILVLLQAINTTTCIANDTFSPVLQKFINSENQEKANLRGTKAAHMGMTREEVAHEMGPEYGLFIFPVVTGEELNVALTKEKAKKIYGAVIKHLESLVKQKILKSLTSAGVKIGRRISSVIWDQHEQILPIWHVVILCNWTPSDMTPQETTNMLELLSQVHAGNLSFVRPSIMANDIARDRSIGLVNFQKEWIDVLVLDEAVVGVKTYILKINSSQQLDAADLQKKIFFTQNEDEIGKRTEHFIGVGFAIRVLENNFRHVFVTFLEDTDFVKIISDRFFFNTMAMAILGMSERTSFGIPPTPLGELDRKELSADEFTKLKPIGGESIGVTLFPKIIVSRCTGVGLKFPERELDEGCDSTPNIGVITGSRSELFKELKKKLEEKENAKKKSNGGSPESHGTPRNTTNT